MLLIGIGHRYQLKGSLLPIAFDHLAEADMSLIVGVSHQ